jgi:hypothetical protein
VGQEVAVDDVHADSPASDHDGTCSEGSNDVDATELCELVFVRHDEISTGFQSRSRVGGWCRIEDGGRSLFPAERERGQRDVGGDLELNEHNRGRGEIGHRERIVGARYHDDGVFAGLVDRDQRAAC